MCEPPLVAITMGDPTGVGPEIVMKALSCPELSGRFRPLVVGNPRLLKQRARPELSGSVFPVEEAPRCAAPPGTIPVLDPQGRDLSGLQAGRPCALSGAAALSYIKSAAALAMSGKAAAIVTAPISKQAIQAAGCSFAGHTELLAHLTGSKDYAMLLVGGKLRVALATIHIGLARVPQQLQKEKILAVIRLLHRELPRLGAGRRRIAVAALNPHAGEGGIFGAEEREKISPAIEQARAEGIQASGPYPADSLFWRADKGEFDAVVAMYHDQGLIPLKLQAFHRGVNVTLGLPIIRTSPDHGCAFELAGSGRADPSSLVEAIKLALHMVNDGRANPTPAAC